MNMMFVKFAIRIGAILLGLAVCFVILNYFMKSLMRPKPPATSAAPASAAVTSPKKGGDEEKGKADLPEPAPVVPPLASKEEALPPIKADEPPIKEGASALPPAAEEDVVADIEELSDGAAVDAEGGEAKK